MFAFANKDGGMGALVKRSKKKEKKKKLQFQLDLGGGKKDFEF